MELIVDKYHHGRRHEGLATDGKELSMDDSLAWLTAGLIFLWILGTHDARAAALDSGVIRSELRAQRAFLPRTGRALPACAHRIRPPAACPAVMTG
jgi:hypothetical protein